MTKAQRLSASRRRKQQTLASNQSVCCKPTYVKTDSKKK